MSENNCTKGPVVTVYRCSVGSFLKWPIEVNLPQCMRETTSREKRGQGTWAFLLQITSREVVIPWEVCVNEQRKFVMCENVIIRSERSHRPSCFCVISKTMVSGRYLTSPVLWALLLFANGLTLRSVGSDGSISRFWSLSVFGLLIFIMMLLIIMIWESYIVMFV